MRLIEVSHCAMVSHHYDRSSTDLESTDREAAKRILLKQYGSKNDRNILERRERMKVNVDIVKEQLDKTVDGNTLKKRQSVTLTFTGFFNICV